MKPKDLLPNLPHEGPPIPRFLTLTPVKEEPAEEHKHNKTAERALELGKKIVAGKITREEAVETLIEETNG